MAQIIFTVPELKAYLGILIILGINPVKQHQMAFSTDPFLGNEGIRKTMTLKRFEKIAQYFHISDCTKEPGQNDDNYDPLYKVKPIITALSTHFLQYCGSGGTCAIDESMIKCKSRLPYIIYQPQSQFVMEYKFLSEPIAHLAVCSNFKFLLGPK